VTEKRLWALRVVVTAVTDRSCTRAAWQAEWMLDIGLTQLAQTVPVAALQLDQRINAVAS